MSELTVDIDDPTPPDQLPCTVQTLVRPLDKFPPKFQAAASAVKKGSISAESSERILLNKLLRKSSSVCTKDFHSINA